MLFLIVRRPPSTTRSATTFPFPTLFRSAAFDGVAHFRGPFLMEEFGTDDGTAQRDDTREQRPTGSGVETIAHSLEFPWISVLAASVASPRSEERRVGKECVRTCRSRGSPHH